MGRQSTNVQIVLDRHRYPVKRPEPLPGCLSFGGGLGRLRGAVTVDQGEGVEFRIEPVAALQIHLQQLRRRDLSRREALGERGGLLAPELRGGGFDALPGLG